MADESENLNCIGEISVQYRNDPHSNNIKAINARNQNSNSDNVYDDEFFQGDQDYVWTMKTYSLDDE